MKNWKRAVFTVEAAVIVPLCVTVTALLIGYCYFAHQMNWCRGAAYEAALKGVEKGTAEKKDGAKERMDLRLEEIPVNAGEINAQVSEGLRVRISWNGSILAGIFGELFGFQGKALLTDIDPVKVKRTAFLFKER